MISAEKRFFGEMHSLCSRCAGGVTVTLPALVTRGIVTRTTITETVRKRLLTGIRSAHLKKVGEGGRGREDDAPLPKEEVIFLGTCWIKR